MLCLRVRANDHTCLCKPANALCCTQTTSLFDPFVILIDRVPTTMNVHSPKPYAVGFQSRLVEHFVTRIVPPRLLQSLATSKGSCMPRQVPSSAPCWLVREGEVESLEWTLGRR